MKVFAPIVVGLAAAVADEKKVPPRHPLQRLATLERFACEWLNKWTKPKVADHWCIKYQKNTWRFERRFELCPHYDDNQEHGGPPERKRRSNEEWDFLRAIDWASPEAGIKQITTGFRKWAERYVSQCKLQPKAQVDRANKWYGILLTKIATP